MFMDWFRKILVLFKNDFFLHSNKYKVIKYIKLTNIDCILSRTIANIRTQLQLIKMKTFGTNITCFLLYYILIPIILPSGQNLDLISVLLSMDYDYIINRLITSYIMTIYLINFRMKFYI